MAIRLVPNVLSPGKPIRNNVHGGISPPVDRADNVVARCLRVPGIPTSQWGRPFSARHFANVLVHFGDT